METKIYQIKKDAADHAAIEEAAKVIRNGGLVAFPTETVYGLGADAQNPQAAEKIYAAKGRPSDNPLIVHIAQKEDLSKAAGEIPKAAALLAEAFWPGPLTMILRKQTSIPKETTGGLDTVAVRMPDHPTALALIRKSGCLIAAPSANASGRPSPTLARHVAEDLNGKIPMILDGGEVGIGIESTIVDLTEKEPVILRPGYITGSMLEAVIGPVKLDAGILCADASVRPKAPGMKYRHYAPRAEMIVVEGRMEQVVEKINALADAMRAQNRKTGIIGTDETISSYRGDVAFSLGSRADAEEIARRLYRILRELDESGVDIIYSESIAAQGIGQAVRNRLLKAAGYQTLAPDENSGGWKIVS